MWRSHVRDAAHRVYLTLTRGTLKKSDDKKFWQYNDIDLFSGETIKNVERIQQYGYTAHPLPEKDAKDKHTAEVIVAFLGGNRAHPMIFGIDDRRHRLKNLQEGEVAMYDDLGQRVHIKRSTISLESPMTITHRIVFPQQDEGQQTKRGDKPPSQGSDAQKAGTKQDAQQTRTDRTRITQGTDHITFEVLDGSGTVKSSIRMDQNGITSKADNMTDQVQDNLNVTVGSNYSVKAEKATLSSEFAAGWLD